jgi:predicted amidophosphoribosyltransferase
MYALGRYRAAHRGVVLAYKERGRRDLAVPLGSRLAMAVPWLPGARADPDGRWWLVPAPSRPAESRRRGGAHMLRLARRCAATLAESGRTSAVAPALVLDARTGDSVGLTAAARLANLSGRVRFHRSGAPPPGTPVVLLDDVVTTGATVAACTAVLRAAGLPVTAVLTLTATD